MAEKEPEKVRPDAQPMRVEHDVPLDTKLLSDAVIELNISRKNVGIYPPGHIQITRSIDRAYEILQQMFAVRPEMTLGIAKDTLLVGQDYLDRKNPVYRDFALSLNKQGIGAVTFVQGLEKDELVKFHRIITTKPDEIAAGGGIQQVMIAAELRHIIIKAIDYESFHLTEEQEIFTAQAAGGGKDKTGLWQDFVSHLAAGTLARPGVEQGVSIKDAAQIDPAELARLLNERKLDPGMALESYDSVITSHVRSAAEKKELTREQSETLKSLNNLVKNLAPELRKQFLSVAFDRASSHVPARVSEEVLGGFTDDMVIEMLNQASSEGREISPTLAGLVRKLSVTGEAPSQPSRRQSAPSAPTPPPGPVIPQEQMQKLFEREGYEAYVVPEYGELLRGLTEGAAPAMEPIPTEEYAESLEDRHVDFQIGRALLAFLEEDIDEEDYREFARKIAAIVPDLLYALGPGVVPGLMDIFANDESLGGRKVLFDLLCRFGKGSVEEAQKRFGDPRSAYVRNLVMIIRREGTPASVPSLKPLLQHQDRKVRMEALGALLRFKDLGAIAVLREALRSQDPDESSQAVFMAGQNRVTAVVDDLLSLIKKVILFDTDYQVNEELVRALGEIGDPRAVPELEKRARMHLTLYPNSLARMKASLFESLERYPRESIAGLIKTGLRSSDEKVLRACKKLAERK